MLSVVLVAGLHVAARRAAVDGLLAARPGGLALHHDLSTAATGTVVRTVRRARATVRAGEAPLVNDCACCALREDLVPELERLAATGECAYAVVELWDSVEPRAMAEVIADCAAPPVRLAGVLTAVDPALVLPYLSCGDELADVGLAAAPVDRRTVADTFARQVEYPTLLAVDAPTEQAHAGSPAADRALLDQLHPTARKLPARAPELFAAATAGFDPVAAAARQHPACALLPQNTDAHGVATWVWRRRRPLHPERLYAALRDVACAAPRSRGRFWLAERPDSLLAWDAAGGSLSVGDAGPWLAALPDAAWELVPPERRAAAALDWTPEQGDRCQHLVFVAPELDVSGLRTLLDSCLLTEAEYAAGRAAWRRLPSAFGRLLDSVP